jgi:hypothetical protein
VRFYKFQTKLKEKNMLPWAKMSSFKSTITVLSTRSLPAVLHHLTCFHFSASALLETVIYIYMFLRDSIREDVYVLRKGNCLSRWLCRWSKFETWQNRTVFFPIKRRFTNELVDASGKRALIVFLLLSFSGVCLTYASCCILLSPNP